MVFIGYTRGGGASFFWESVILEGVLECYLFKPEFTCLNRILPVCTGFCLFEPDSTCLHRILPVCTGFYLFELDSTCLNRILRGCTRFYLFEQDSLCLNRILPVWTGLTNLTGLITNPPSIATRQNPDIHKNAALRP